MNVGSLCASAIFAFTPPHSRFGQLLFWPQDILPFLRVQHHPFLGERIAFVVLVIVASACVQALVILSKACFCAGAGTVAMIAPLIGWFLIGPHGGVPDIQSPGFAMQDPVCGSAEAFPAARSVWSLFSVSGF